MAKSTTNYKQFKIMGGNRALVKAHIDKLAKSIALYPELLEVRPILVNSKMEVIDGQHRLAACKALKIPVYYTVGENLSTDDAIVINNNQRNWSLFDYAKSYAQQGKQAYKDFLRVQERFPTLPVYTIIRYIGGNGREITGLNGTFRAGTFQTKIITLGEVYLEMLEELADVNPRFGRTQPSRAMFDIFQISAYDHDRMLKKLSFVPETMVKLYGSAEDVLRNLEDIYNFKQQSDTLRFY